MLPHTERYARHHSAYPVASEHAGGAIGLQHLGVRKLLIEPGSLWEDDYFAVFLVNRELFAML